ncbi:hypothetical protein OUZ56_016481 [Daphnia magna]|uniref:Uncharacterized protein n=1 Tax=Daphnia magna TaxID=35525 RepID=A0ABR0AQN2_9CRUS|nr:hypothetical protein OUZ56_016481 [Daphnia magna]
MENSPSPTPSLRSEGSRSACQWNIAQGVHVHVLGRVRRNLIKVEVTVDPIGRITEVGRIQDSVGGATHPPTDLGIAEVFQDRILLGGTEVGLIY